MEEDQNLNKDTNNLETPQDTPEFEMQKQQNAPDDIPNPQNFEQFNETFSKIETPKNSVNISKNEEERSEESDSMVKFPELDVSPVKEGRQVDVPPPNEILKPSKGEENKESSPVVLTKEVTSDQMDKLPPVDRKGNFEIVHIIEKIMP